MSLNSKKIAFTGALQMKRKDAEKQAEEAGVTVTAVFTGKNSLRRSRVWFWGEEDG